MYRRAVIQRGILRFGFPRTTICRRKNRCAEHDFKLSYSQFVKAQPYYFLHFSFFALVRKRQLYFERLIEEIKALIKSKMHNQQVSK